MYVFYAAAVVALALSFLVETSSWWIKGLSAPGQLGLYMSRSNIYLYFGRFFALAFNALIAVRIEHGDKASQVMSGLYLGFFAAALLHFLMLRGTRITWRFMGLLRRILVLPTPQREVTGPPAAIRWTLMLSTSLSSFAFSLGITVPLCLAILVPEYRMSLSYAGQLLNAGGTLLLLFYVDQMLFRALDRDELLMELPSYSAGRIIGFILGGGLCYLFGIVAPMLG